MANLKAIRDRIRFGQEHPQDHRGHAVGCGSQGQGGPGKQVLRIPAFRPDRLGSMFGKISSRGFSLQRMSANTPLLEQERPSATSPWWW